MPSAQELAAAGVTATIVDVFVSAGIADADRSANSEPSIAISLDQTKIDITAFGPPGDDAFSVSPWPAPTDVWHSGNGGVNWTRQFTVPKPPMVNFLGGCPCDQAIDTGPDGNLRGTFLTGGKAGGAADPNPANVYTGGTMDITNLAAWMWWVVNGVAQRTNLRVINNVDQPWLLVGRNPANAYVAYDDFTVRPVALHVSSAPPALPPAFTSDIVVGFSTGGGINPGLRLATDPNSGAVYALFQQCVLNCNSATGLKGIRYVLNRSANGGVTWTLNGSPTGFVAASGLGSQPTPKFGTVNALLGGVDHVAADPQLLKDHERRKRAPEGGLGVYRS